MKIYTYSILIAGLLTLAQSANAQCAIPNRDFSDYWIVTIFTDNSENFDPAHWTATWPSFQNSGSYKGVYTAPGSTGPYDAVHFLLDGPNREVGIKTYEPIECQHFPSGITGHFKHLQGDGTDTLKFKLHLSNVDMWGDTTREVLEATQICGIDISTGFESFTVPMPLPHFNIYAQIDSLEISYRSVAQSPGSFILDDLDFVFTTSTQESALEQQIRILPNLTAQRCQLKLPEPMPGMQITLINTAGTVLTNSISGENEVLEINLEGMPAGLYFVQGNYPQGQISFTRKIVKI